MARRPAPPSVPPPAAFTTADQVDRAISKLERRIKDVIDLNVEQSFRTEDGRIDNVESSVRNTIREVFGEGSPEFDEHKYIEIWSGPIIMGMPEHQRLAGRIKGQTVMANTLNGLIERLREKKQDIVGSEGLPSP